TACLMRPPKRTSTRNAAPRCPTTVPVMPWKRWCGHPFCRLESITIVTRSPTSKDWNDRVMGESPRWRGPRRNFCRVFSMIPFEGALSDRLGHQNRERALKLCFLHGRCHPQEDAVRLRGPILFQWDHVGPAGRRQPVDFDDPRGVDPCDRAPQIEVPPTGLLNLDDEGSAASEHPGVHVLAAHPMQGMARSAGLPQDLVRDDFLHA